MESGCSSKSRSTGHQGFDYWKGEFSSTVLEIETLLHKSEQDTLYTDKLLKEATSMLPNLLQEAESVSRSRNPALRQELMDIYLACKMQLETYLLLLNEQGELFPPCEKHEAYDSNRFGKSSRQHCKTPASTSELWDTNTKNEGQSNRHHSTSRRNQIQSTTKGQVMTQNSRLRDALRSFKESEEIALQISGELKGQRETLEHTQRSMNSVKDMTQQAKGLLKSMNKKWWMKW
jgi:Snare region anchored in the vesicle membrane C-terminus